MANKLNKRIVEARKKAGIRQKELAEQLNIAYQTLNKYEKGHRTPGSDILRQMANILNCNPGWLLTGDGEISRHKIYSDEEGIFRAAGGYHVDDPELMLIIDDLISSGAEDRKLLRLVKKLIYIYNDGNMKQRALVRGTIDELCDEIKKQEKTNQKEG